MGKVLFFDDFIKQHKDDEDKIKKLELEKLKKHDETKVEEKKEEVKLPKLQPGDFVKDKYGNTYEVIKTTKDFKEADEIDDWDQISKFKDNPDATFVIVWAKKTKQKKLVFVYGIDDDDDIYSVKKTDGAKKEDFYTKTFRKACEEVDEDKLETFKRKWRKFIDMVRDGSIKDKKEEKLVLNQILSDFGILEALKKEEEKKDKKIEESIQSGIYIIEEDGSGNKPEKKEAPKKEEKPKEEKPKEEPKKAEPKKEEPKKEEPKKEEPKEDKKEDKKEEPKKDSEDKGDKEDSKKDDKDDKDTEAKDDDKEKSKEDNEKSNGEDGEGDSDRAEDEVDNTEDEEETQLTDTDSDANLGIGSHARHAAIDRSILNANDTDNSNTTISREDGLEPPKNGADDVSTRSKDDSTKDMKPADVDGTKEESKEKKDDKKVFYGKEEKTVVGDEVGKNIYEVSYGNKTYYVHPEEDDEEVFAYLDKGCTEKAVGKYSILKFKIKTLFNIEKYKDSFSTPRELGIWNDEKEAKERAKENIADIKAEEEANKDKGKKDEE